MIANILKKQDQGTNLLDLFFDQFHFMALVIVADKEMLINSTATNNRTPLLSVIFMTTLSNLNGLVVWFVRMEYKKIL